MRKGKIMRKVKFMLILFVVFFVGHLMAENKDDNKISQQEIEKRIKASEKLVIAMKLKENWQEVLNNMVGVQAKQFPEMIDEMIKIYAEEFTVAEIKQITEFYKTPVGEKLALKMPILAKKGAEVGQKKVQDNMLELQMMISNKMAEMQETKKVDPNE